MSCTTVKGDQAQVQMMCAIGLHASSALATTAMATSLLYECTSMQAVAGRTTWRTQRHAKVFLKFFNVNADNKCTHSHARYKDYEFLNNKK